MIVENDKMESSDAHSVALDHDWLAVLRLYGEGTTMTLDPVILADYFPDGFGKGKHTVAEYGLFLVFLAHYGTPLTFAQLKELQPYATTNNLNVLLGKMTDNGILERKGQNYRLIARSGHDYARIADALRKMVPLAQQFATAVRHFLEEFDSQNNNGRR